MNITLEITWLSLIFTSFYLYELIKFVCKASCMYQSVCIIVDYRSNPIFTYLNNTLISCIKIKIAHRLKSGRIIKSFIVCSDRNICYSLLIKLNRSQTKLSECKGQ